MARTSRRRTTKEDLINKLIEHHVALMNKNTELITGMRDLTGKVDRMVALFEEAAKHIKQGTDEPLMNKLEGLLEQNKTIAKGLILLEKYVRDKSIGSSQMGGMAPSRPPLPKAPPL